MRPRIQRLLALFRRWQVPLSQTNLRALQIFVRLVPSERQRLFALTLVIGVVCGFAAVAFHLAIQGAEHLMIDRAMAASGRSWIAWTILTPTVGGLIGGILLHYVVPDARGSGIPQVKVAYAITGGHMPFRVAVGKFVIGVFQIGSGASLGREGPTVQICAGIASFLGRLVALPRRSLPRLLPVGAAAGIAAAFNAPIAAVTFTIEEVVGDLDQTVLSGVVVAAALAAAIERSVLGEQPVFAIPAGYGLHHASSLLLYLVLGVAAAGASVIFTDALLGLRAWFKRLNAVPPWARPAIGGFVTGALAVVAVLFLQSGGITGGGYDTLAVALAGKLAFKTMLALSLMKLAATVFSYSSGGAGGIFAPSLFIGGMLGGAIGYLDVVLLHHSQSEIGAFALVGMGAAFAGIVRAPMTSVLIIFEMTGGYGLILPLMLANMVAYGLARRLRPNAIYDALLEQDGVHLPHRRGLVTHALEQIRVGQVMTAPTFVLLGSLRVAEAVERITQVRDASYPVLGEQGRLLGLITEARLRRTLAEGGGERTLQQLVDRRPPLHPDQPLVDAVVAMVQWEARELAVVEHEDNDRLAGVITMSDIVRAQAGAALRSGHPGPGGLPQLSEVGETLKA